MRSKNFYSWLYGRLGKIKVFKSIQSTILVLFSLLIIAALMIFLLISLNYTERTVVENSTDYTMQLVSQVNNDIDSYIEYMQNISLMFSSNSDVQNFVAANYTTSSMGTLEWGRIATKLFTTIMDARSDIYNIGILSNDGRYILNYGYDELNPYVDLTKVDWYQKTLDAKGHSVLSSSHVQTLIKGDYKWVITMSASLLDPILREPSGILFIDLNYSAIQNLCANISLGSKGYVFILDKEGNIIYHPKQKLIYSGLKTEEIEKVMALNGQDGNFVVKEEQDNKLYTACTSKNTGWTVVSVAYTSELMKNKAETQELYLIVAILLLILTLLISTFISSGITRPIRQLQRSMSAVEKGNFEMADITVAFENELGSLRNSFNLMIGEIQKLMEENIDEQRQKRSSELRALQAQINPHFLYNTLDSIIWMSEIGKNDEVVIMTSSLAKLLRKSISNSDELVTIADELSYTETYLTIQKIRYQDKLEFFIDVNEDILSHAIIKLILQPLVENAIYHGIKYKTSIGIIYISGEFEDGCIALHVDDNGVGMDAETLSHLFEPKQTEKSSSGVGINNIQGRLQLYYGSEYGLSYESSLERGTIATIRIPVQQEDIIHETE